MLQVPLVSIAWSKLLLRCFRKASLKLPPFQGGGVMGKKGNMNKPVLNGQWSQKPKDWGRVLSFTLLLRTPSQKEGRTSWDAALEGWGGRLTLQFTQKVWLRWLIWGQRLSMVGLQKGPDLCPDGTWGEITEDTTPSMTSERLTGNHEALRMVHPRD